jgi:hypothetical protein
MLTHFNSTQSNLIQWKPFGTPGCSQDMHFQFEKMEMASFPTLAGHEAISCVLKVGLKSRRQDHALA